MSTDNNPDQNPNPEQAPQVGEPKTVFVSCRREGCDNKTSRLVVKQGGFSMFVCTKCGYNIGVNTGGHFPY